MKNKQLCLCIPRISVNTTKQFIWNRLVELELGNIDKIIEIPLKNDSSYKRVLIKLHYTNEDLFKNIKNYFLENKCIKYVYQMPWYWKIFLTHPQR
tara:strand:- start:1980 stop:2267 length:288 start_codon:yes stop_codon:yes gene_type:complete